MRSDLDFAMFNEAAVHLRRQIVADMDHISGASRLDVPKSQFHLVIIVLGTDEAEGRTVEEGLKNFVAQLSAAVHDAVSLWVVV